MAGQEPVPPAGILAGQVRRPPLVGKKEGVATVVQGARVAEALTLSAL